MEVPEPAKRDLMLPTLPSDQQVLSITAQSSETQSPKSVKRTFACPHCPASYESARALGGHASKQHKGMSDAYNRKMKVRQERESKRQALKLA